MDTSRMIPGHSGWGYRVLGPHRQASLKMKEYWFDFEYVEVRSADKIFSGCPKWAMKWLGIELKGEVRLINLGIIQIQKIVNVTIMDEKVRGRKRT